MIAIQRKILPRTHSVDDMEFLRSAGVELALMSERESGLQMAHFALTNNYVDRRASERTMRADAQKFSPQLTR